MSAKYLLFGIAIGGGLLLVALTVTAFYALYHMGDPAEYESTLPIESIVDRGQSDTAGSSDVAEGPVVVSDGGHFSIIESPEWGPPIVRELNDRVVTTWRTPQFDTPDRDSTVAAWARPDTMPNQLIEMTLWSEAAHSEFEDHILTIRFLETP